MNHNTSPKTQPQREIDCERLLQALSTFTGILKESSDPKVREAAHQLWQGVKGAKIKV